MIICKHMNKFKSELESIFNETSLIYILCEYYNILINNTKYFEFYEYTYGGCKPNCNHHTEMSDIDVIVDNFDSFELTNIKISDDMQSIQIIFIICDDVDRNFMLLLEHNNICDNINEIHNHKDIVIHFVKRHFIRFINYLKLGLTKFESKY